jgi:hypothetical protein
MSQVLGYARERSMSLLLALFFDTFFWHFLRLRFFELRVLMYLYDRSFFKGDESPNDRSHFVLAP